MTRGWIVREAAGSVSVLAVTPDEDTTVRVFYSFERAFRRAKRLAGWDKEIAE